MNRSGGIGLVGIIGFGLFVILGSAFLLWCYRGKPDTYIIGFHYNADSENAGARAPRLTHPDGRGLWGPDLDYQNYPGTPFPASRSLVPGKHNEAITTWGVYPGGSGLQVTYRSTGHWKIGRKNFARCSYPQPARIEVKLQDGGEVSWRVWESGYRDREFQPGTVRDGDKILLGAWGGSKFMLVTLRFDGPEGCAIYVRGIHPGSRQTLDVSLAPGGPAAPAIPKTYYNPDDPMLRATRANYSAGGKPAVPVRFLMPDGSEPGTLWWRSKQQYHLRKPGDDIWQVVENESNPTPDGEYAGSAAVGQTMPAPLDPTCFLSKNHEQNQQHTKLLRAKCSVVHESPSGGLSTNITYMGVNILQPFRFGFLPGTNVIRNVLGRPPGKKNEYTFRENKPEKPGVKRPRVLLVPMHAEEVDGRPATSTVFRAGQINDGWEWNKRLEGVERWAGGGGYVWFRFRRQPVHPEAVFVHREDEIPLAASASDETLLTRMAFWPATPPSSSNTSGPLLLRPQPSLWVRGVVTGKLTEVWSIRDNPDTYHLPLLFSQDGEDYLISQPFGVRPPHLRFIFQYPAPGGHGMITAQADLKAASEPKRILRFDLKPGKPEVTLVRREHLPVRLSLPNGRPAPAASMWSSRKHQHSPVVEREGASWIQVDQVKVVENDMGWVRAGMPGNTLDAWFKVPLDAPELELKLPPLVHIRGRLVPPPAPHDPLPLVGIRPDWPAPWDGINKVASYNGVVYADGDGRFGFPRVREGPVAMIYKGEVITRFVAKGPEMEIVLNRK